jgi:hypothetical protein
MFDINIKKRFFYIKLLIFIYNNILKNPEFVKDIKSKSKIQRVIIGLIHGWETSLLPKKIEKFNNILYIKIFRVFGLISLIFFIFKIYLSFNLFFLYIVLIFTLFHYIYIYFINFTKVIFGSKLLLSGKLEVKDFPLDPLATLSKKLIFCCKISWIVSLTGLGIVARYYLISQILDCF